MRALPLALALCALSLSPAAAQDWVWTRVGYEWSGAVDLSADVDGDGLADVLIGDRLASPGGEAQACSSVTGLVIHSITGVSGSGYGANVLGLPDLDGDGHDEFAFSGNFTELWVIDGDSGSTLNATGGSTHDVRIESIADLNGDGFDDMLVSNPGSGVGQVEAISGRWFVDGTQPLVLWVAQGSVFGGRFGEDIAVIGDVNGDGLEDTVVGAPEEDGVSGLFAYHGQIHCLSGADGSKLWTRRWYATSSTRFGGSVGWIGDYDGDGIDDALAGAPWNDSNALDGGAYFILSGAHGGYLVQYYHSVNGDMYGSDVAGVGDFDQDGTPDYLVGAEGDNNALGSASLYSGLTGVPFWKRDGVGFLGRRGTLDGGADATGDGVPDFVLSSPGGGFGLGQVELWKAPCNGGWSPYCQSTANSTGLAATLHTSGSTSISANALTFEARKCPPDNLGIFFFGTAANQMPFGDGFLCLGGTITRLMPAQVVDDFGFAQLTPDLQSAPFDGGALLPGDTRYFQFWYRDPDLAGGSGFNLTNGRQVTFCP